MWWHWTYCKESPFCLYHQNTQDPKKGVKPSKKNPKVGINKGKIFGSVSRDSMPLIDC